MAKDHLSEILAILDRIKQLARGTRFQRFLHHPIKYATAIGYQRFIYPRYKKEWRRSALTFFGEPMTIALPAGMDIFLLGAKTHDSEIRLTQFMLRYLKPGDVMADVGAHFGFYSLLAAYLVGASGRVFAFEASPKISSILQQNIQALPQITNQNAAVSDINGKLTFYEFPTQYSEYNTSMPTQFERQDWYQRMPPSRIEVPAVSLDKFFSNLQMAPKLIKIDVEGAELQVIRGAQHLLSENSPTIAMEFLAARRNNNLHHQALEILQQAGYHSYLIDQNGRLQSCDDFEQSLSDRNLDSDNIVLTKTAE